MSGSDSDDGGKKPEDALLVVDIGLAMQIAWDQMAAKQKAFEVAEARHGLHLVPAPPKRKRKPPAKP